MPHLAIIPAAAVADPNLTDTQVRVLCAIGTHTNRLGGNVWASISTLAKACSLSTRTVQRALPALLERGYLRHLERPGRTTLYEIVLEQGVTMQSGGGDSVVGGGVTTQSPKRLKNDKTNDLRELANLVLRTVTTQALREK
jgi:DNA-binding transcriptional MocR family regulator